MRSLLSVAVLAGVLSIASVGFAAPRQASAAKPAAKAASTSAQKAVKGVVKSVSDSSLVIERGTKAKPQDLTFVLNAATQKAGNVAVGQTVSVRYHSEGGQNIASAVSGSGSAKAKG